MRIRLSDRRWYLGGGLGLGWLGISNLKAGSALLAPVKGTYNVPDPVGAFELRPAAALQLQLGSALALFASPALSFTPKPTNFYAALGRFELMFGLTYYL